MRLTQRDMLTYSQPCPTLFQCSDPSRHALHPSASSMPLSMRWHESIAVLHSAPALFRCEAAARVGGARAPEKEAGWGAP